MKKYAVLIGNSEFPDESDKSKLPTLNCPERDVDGLADVLSSERGEFSVLPLKNQASYQILDKLEDVVNQAKKDDLLLIYYSGHGKPNRAGILHLTTLDTTVNKLGSRAISIQRVYDILAMGNCKKVIIILDCCFSGAAEQGFKGSFDDQLQQINNSRGTYLITSSSKEQVSKDGKPGGYSLFTQHLITGLETSDADKDNNGWISMDELYDYIHSKVTAEYPEQQPTKHVKDVRGDLIIAKSGKDSRKDRAEKIRLLLLEFEKQHEDIAEIKTEALAIAKTDMAKLSPVQLEKDRLLTGLLNEKITLLSFVRAWDKLATKPTTKKSAKPKMTASPLKDWQSSKATKMIVATFIITFVAVGFILSDVWKPEVNSKQQKSDSKIFTPAKLGPSTPETAANLVLKSEPITVNGVDFDMVAIKGGTFQMGSSDIKNEKQHEVTVADFQMGKYEVTQKQWRAIMDNNPASFKGDNLPVEQISWNEVQDFVSRLNQATENTGHKFSLPTEAQWEYAARAGTTSAFYTGNCINTEQANYDGDDYNDCGAKTGVYKGATVLVGSYPANPWGLYDMAGNVWEWTCSAYVELYDGSETKCDSINKQHVLRGGSWRNISRFLRSANRTAYSADDHYNYIGFRLSRM